MPLLALHVDGDSHEMEKPVQENTPQAAPTIVVVDALDKVVEVGNVNPSPHSLFPGASRNGVGQEGPRLRSTQWSRPEAILVMQPLVALGRFPLRTGPPGGRPRYRRGPRLGGRRAALRRGCRRFGILLLNEKRPGDIVVGVVVNRLPRCGGLPSAPTAPPPAIPRPRLTCLRPYSFCVLQVVVVEVLIKVFLVQGKSHAFFHVGGVLSCPEFVVEGPTAAGRDEAREDVGRHGGCDATLDVGGSEAS